MYDDDEEDLALLEQYEREGAKLSDDDLDSDLEDKIMSAVQYETDATRQWSTGQSQKEPNSTNGQSTIPPIAMTQQKSDDSTDDNSSISSVSDSDNDKENDQDSHSNAPPIIRHIDLNITGKDMQQDDATDEEEEVLNHQLQELIDQQIRQRKNRNQSFKRPKQIPFCFSCLSPGHIQRDCSLCSDCGNERHPSGSCPGVQYCYRCKERGHYAMDCRNKRCYDLCRHCGEDYHASQWCPKLVHVYKDQVSPVQKVERYCYNCGRKGHYGDECPSLSESAQSQQSVFSFNSLSISGDPRRQYHGSHNSRSSSQSSKRPRHDRSRHASHHRFNDLSDSDNDRPAKKSSKNKERNTKHHPSKQTEMHRQKKPNKGRHGNAHQETGRGSGNSNWKALTKASASKSNSGYTNSNRIENDFPRNLPKPSFSGVINTESAGPRPKYTGGYNRL